MSLSRLVGFLHGWRRTNPTGTKAQLCAALIDSFGLSRQRALHVGPDFAIRVSQSRDAGAFSNTIVALRKVLDLDHIPIVACRLAPGSITLRLANSTFLTKVSHTSHGLAITHIVGSILGTDIASQHEGILNSPEEFDRLFAIHTRQDRRAKLARIVAATRGIGARSRVWLPSDSERTAILRAPGLAARVSSMQAYRDLATQLDDLTQTRKAAILVAADIEDPKSRGDEIERLVLGTRASHALGDTSQVIENITIAVDLKSKRLDLESAPKGYNIDKLCRWLAKGDHLLSMFFVGIDTTNRTLRTRLCSVLDRTMLGASRVDERWSGRGTRGTVQFGDLHAIWRPDFEETIDVQQADRFLRALIEPNDG